MKQPRREIEIICANCGHTSPAKFEKCWVCLVPLPTPAATGAATAQPSFPVAGRPSRRTASRISNVASGIALGLGSLVIGFFLALGAIFALILVILIALFQMCSEILSPQ